MTYRKHYNVYLAANYTDVQCHKNFIFLEILIDMFRVEENRLVHRATVRVHLLRGMTRKIAMSKVSDVFRCSSYLLSIMPAKILIRPL